MSGETIEKTIRRDTVVKFCNAAFFGPNYKYNGRYGLVRNQIHDGIYRIMQTSGRDRSVKKDYFEVQEIDLNTPVQNGVVLVFPPSTGKTGTKPTAIPLPDFPHEFMATGDTPHDNLMLVKTAVCLMPEMLRTERIMMEKYMLNDREMRNLKAFVNSLDSLVDSKTGVLKEDFTKDCAEIWNWAHRFVRCRYNNMIRRNWCIKNLGWEKPLALMVYEDPENCSFRTQPTQAVYWYDEAAKNGIDNTFLCFHNRNAPGEEIRGAVIFDFSCKKMSPKENNKLEAERWKDSFNELLNFYSDFDSVKTLGDFQDFIFRQSVMVGSHPSNPWAGKKHLGSLEDHLRNGDNTAEMNDHLKDLVEKLRRFPEEKPTEWKRVQKDFQNDVEKENRRKENHSKKRNPFPVEKLSF